jgi:hypothetical protein
MLKALGKIEMPMPCIALATTAKRKFVERASVRALG